MVAFYARRPELHLVLPDETPELTSSLQKRYERRVANDALYLPKSTNMGLPAWMSTGEKYNYEDEDEGVTSIKTPPPSRSATFKRSIPCFFVSHIPTALPWYEEVLGFKVVGKADAGRAELHRAAPGSSPKTTGQGSVDGVSIYLRRHLDAESAPPKGSLWIEVDKVDDLYQEVTHKLEKYAQGLDNYFPPRHFGSAKVQAKPRNSGFGERAMTVVDDAGNSIIFFQVLDQ